MKVAEQGDTVNWRVLITQGLRVLSRDAVQRDAPR